MCLATELVEIVSKGLLSTHPDLVAGLCEMLKLGCMVGFDTDVVNDMLQHYNLRIFKDDESFLLEYIPVEDSLELHQGGSCSRGSRKGFESLARPAKSLDFVQGWEKRLQFLRQAIDKMTLDYTSCCLKMEVNLEKMLLPYHEQDSSGLHVIKVTGDACLKILTISQALGCQMMPFKLEDLLCDEVIESDGKCFGLQSQCEFEMLKVIAGAATLKVFAGDEE